MTDKLSMGCGEPTNSNVVFLDDYRKVNKIAPTRLPFCVQCPEVRGYVYGPWGWCQVCMRDCKFKGLVP